MILDLRMYQAIQNNFRTTTEFKVKLQDCFKNCDVIVQITRFIIKNAPFLL